ncbi:hypothetical protein N7474_004635 [Penicillium riverlandense]|uniref:uncharacterized protein n=1 Tax=Penicillium riverlandense TaxID=1903569 RepID=UPI00254789BF|nr:uncharacterized protein N7474_004635 [Penicillium riverlandense]KAJ5819044.1 hypothetical protein N7474_004635 [Penicillium riverlandense]
MAQSRQQQQAPPPQQSQFSQPFSPPVSSPSPNSGSPVNGGPAPPPSKRPRLSPLPPSGSQSPYASPSFGSLQLPQGQPSMNGSTMNSMPSTPAAPAPAPPGAMGPPSRPADKVTDAAELTDVLASSGIDVREEEAFLTRSFGGPNTASQPTRSSQTPAPLPLSTSFSSQVSTPGTLSASASFNELPQIKPATPQESFSTEPASQTSVPFKDPNEPTRQDTEAARRAQYHLQEPFLLTKLLEQKLQKRGFELGVRIPSEGLFHPVPGRPQPIEVTGPDGSAVVRSGKTILNQEGAPLVDILNLLSLSCEERLRGVVDYSSTLSRSRRAHSHGAIPSEWGDVAQPLGPTAGNAGAAKASLKRPYEIYRAIARKEAAQEERREAKRNKRGASAILGEGTPQRSDSIDMGSAPSTPIGERAPSFNPKSISKKEQKKMMDAKASEVQQHQQSVETARLATNSMLSTRRFGGAKKSYSWLKPGGSSSGFTPVRPAPSTPTATPDKPTQPGEATPSQPKRRLGTWREDQEKGLGIQVRDILFMLEVDGRGMKHLQKGYLKDPREDRDRGD